MPAINTESFICSKEYSQLNKKTTNKVSHFPLTLTLCRICHFRLIICHVTKKLPSENVATPNKPLPTEDIATRIQPHPTA